MSDITPSSIRHSLHAHDSLEMDTNNKYKDSYGWEKILGAFGGQALCLHSGQSYYNDDIVAGFQMQVLKEVDIP